MGSPEVWLLIATLLAAFIAWKRKLRGLGWWERPLAVLATRKGLAILVCAAAPIVLRVLLLPLFPAPEPRYHDEFSFLLGADTLLHCRVANPVHPMWVHFESMHMMARPVYMSAFPVGPAAMLALGRLLGHPWIGVLLSCGAMCGTLCWMLQGWMPPRWALLGALFVVLRFGVASYWMNSYWGGALAATGGALVLGAMGRLVRRPDWRYSIAMGAGFVVLANTRTFEGSVFCALVVGASFVTLLGRKRLSIRQVVLPLVLMFAVTAAGLFCYFGMATGDPLQMPYVLYRKSLTLAPHFLFQSAHPEPHYNNRDMRHFYASWEMNDFNVAHRNLLVDLQSKVSSYWRFYVGPLLCIPLIVLLSCWRWRRARLWIAMLLLFVPALAVQVWHNAHYVAPATGLILLCVVSGIRLMRMRGFGLCFARILPLACAAMLVVQILAGGAPNDDSSAPTSGWRWPDYGGRERAALLRQLQAATGDHLVFVRYSRLHDVGNEWVYNDADIDASKVVWARELNRESNLRLMQYFGKRKVWLVEPDTAAPALIAYENAAPRPMFFIPPGAPGIESLRDVESVRAKLHSAVKQPCDAWNYRYTELTGVYGPDPVRGCYDGDDRNVPVGFEHWFQWMLGMRE